MCNFSLALSSCLVLSCSVALKPNFGCSTICFWFYVLSMLIMKHTSYRLMIKKTKYFEWSNWIVTLTIVYIHTCVWILYTVYLCGFFPHLCLLVAEYWMWLHLIHMSNGHWAYFSSKGNHSTWWFSYFHEILSLLSPISILTHTHHTTHVFV